VVGKDYTAVREASTLAFEQAALEAGKRLANRDSAASGDNAVPGNGLTARAGGHGSTGGASSSREPSGTRQLPVGGDAALRNSLHQFVESISGRVHPGKDNPVAVELPVLPL
jgi:hypothetical protein